MNTKEDNPHPNSSHTHCILGISKIPRSKDFGSLPKSTYHPLTARPESEAFLALCMFSSSFALCLGPMPSCRKQNL